MIYFFRNREKNKMYEIRRKPPEYHNFVVMRGSSFLLIYKRVTFQNFTCVDNPVRIPWLKFWMRLCPDDNRFRDDNLLI